MSKLIPLHDHIGNVVAHTVVDDGDYGWVSQHRWRLHSSGYVRRSANGRKLYLHREVLGLRPGDGIKSDHQDRDPLNNQRSNLRRATTAQNNQNTPARSKSGHRGVVFHRPSKKWMAYGRLDGTQHHLGLFDTVEEAAEVATTWRREHLPFSTD